MKLIGKWSVSSVLNVLMNVAQYGIALVIVITSALTVISIFVDMKGAEIDLPVSFQADGRALQVTAPSLGITAARIENARGSLTFQHLDFFTIIHGLIILVIAEVFRAGTRLDEDQSLTI